MLLQNYILLQSSEMQVKLRVFLLEEALSSRSDTSNSNLKAGGAMSDIIVRQVTLIGKGIVEPALRVIGEIVILVGIVLMMLLVPPALLHCSRLSFCQLSYYTCRNLKACPDLMGACQPVT